MSHFTPSAFRRLLAIAATGALLASVAACGGSDEPKSTSSGSGSGTTQLAKDRLEAAYAGLYGEPQDDTPKPEAGKNVWAITYDLSLSFAQQFAAGAEEAGKSLDWNVKVFNAKSDPNEALAGIRAAIAAKADGIVVQSFDCDIVKSGVDQAIAAGIPVIGDQNKDCSPGKFSSVVPYFKGGYPGNDGTFAKWIAAWAKPAADWIAVKSNGSAKVIVVTETDAAATIYQAEGFNEELKEVCPGCEVVDTVEFTAPEIGSALQQKVQQSLLKNPDATAVANTVADYASTGGIAAAIKASGRAQKLLVTGGEGQAANVDLIRKDAGQQTATCQNNGWDAYTALDQLIRLFAGAQPAKSSGNGFVLVDTDNNMPPKGETCVPSHDGEPVDFAGMYEKIWQVG